MLHIQKLLPSEHSINMKRNEGKINSPNWMNKRRDWKWNLAHTIEQDRKRKKEKRVKRNVIRNARLAWKYSNSNKSPYIMYLFKAAKVHSLIKWMPGNAIGRMNWIDWAKWELQTEERKKHQHTPQPSIHSLTQNEKCLIAVGHKCS